MSGFAYFHVLALIFIDLFFLFLSMICLYIEEELKCNVITLRNVCFFPAIK